MLDSRTVSLSLAITVEFLYLACALFFYLFPEAALFFFNTWLHGIDLMAIASGRPVAAWGFFVGSVSVFAVSYVTGAIFAGIYNALGRGRNL
ncbi:MAG: hypothetical protein HY883_04490 [Deltaproteobacteria bacterium]|nr:hypothetical protein [Deltaproteobacteria bacterium]